MEERSRISSSDCDRRFEVPAEGSHRVSSGLPGHMGKLLAANASERRRGNVETLARTREPNRSERRFEARIVVVALLSRLSLRPERADDLIPKVPN
jgi:hypothetical protein